MIINILKTTKIHNVAFQRVQNWNISGKDLKIRRCNESN